MIDDAYAAIVTLLADALSDVNWLEEHPRPSGIYRYPAGFLVPSEAQNTSTLPGMIVVGSLGADLYLQVKDDPRARVTLHALLDRLILATTEANWIRIDSWMFSSMAIGQGAVTELAINLELLEPPTP